MQFSIWNVSRRARGLKMSWGINSQPFRQLNLVCSKAQLLASHGRAWKSFKLFSPMFRFVVIRFRRINAGDVLSWSIFRGRSGSWPSLTLPLLQHCPNVELSSRCPIEHFFAQIEQRTTLFTRHSSSFRYHYMQFTIVQFSIFFFLWLSATFRRALGAKITQSVVQV